MVLWVKKTSFSPFQVSMIHRFCQNSPSFTVIPESGFLYDGERKETSTDVDSKQIFTRKNCDGLCVDSCVSPSRSVFVHVKDSCILDIGSYFPFSWCEGKDAGFILIRIPPVALTWGWRNIKQQLLLQSAVHHSNSWEFEMAPASQLLEGRLRGGEWLYVSNVTDCACGSDGVWPRRQMDTGATPFIIHCYWNSDYNTWAHCRTQSRLHL